MGQTLLGEEYQLVHLQCHVMEQRLPAPGLKISHAESALGVLESPLDKTPGDNHGDGRKDMPRSAFEKT